MIKLNTSKRTLTLLILLVIGGVLTACKKKEFKPEESFIKVYDHADVNRDYFPLGMASTSDGGHLFLSSYNGAKIHLLKADAKGDFLWEFDVPSQYVSAVPNFIEKDGAIYFVCMDAVGLFTYVMQVDETAQNVVVYQQFPTILYPLSVLDNGNSVYIQNYERQTLETGVYALNGTMDQIQNSATFDIMLDAELEIIEHLNYTGKRFPFFLAATPENDHIIFNGFTNYSFSAVFLNPNLDFVGVYSGAAFDGGLSAMMPLGGNQFALSRFSFDDTYVNPSVSLDPLAVEVSESIPAEWASELDADSPILIKSLTIDQAEYTAFMATTKSNQLVLNLYPKGSSELVASKYFGESVPLKVCDFSMTEDDGLLVLMQATVMSSFNRIASVKLSKEELEALVK